MDYQPLVEQIEFAGKRIIVTENEEALIGSVLRGGTSTFNRVREIVSPVMFHNISYGEVWSAIEVLFENGMSIDTITVGDQLERSYKLDTVSNGVRVGRGLLSDMRTMGDPRNVETYAEIIQDYFVKGNLEEFGKKIIVWSANGRRAADIVHDVTSEMGKIVLYSSKANDHVYDISQAASEAYDETVNASKGLIKRVATGIPDMDNLLNGGYTGGQLVIVAARPGQGKTALLVTETLNMIRAGRSVLFFSLEMTARELAQRLIAQISGIDVGRLQAGKLTEAEWSKHAAAVDELAGLKDLLTVIDLPAVKIGTIRHFVRREMVKNKRDVVIVDYLQLAEADNKKDNRYQEVGQISRGLKALAKEADVPILAAAQLSRAPETRTDKHPQLSDLRESGDLEQDSDIVIMIYRDAEEIISKEIPCELLVRKHRNGAVGKIEVNYLPSITRFEGTRKFTGV